MAYTKEQLAFIQENLQDEQDFLRQTLCEMTDMPLPTPLKSAEILQKEQNDQINGIMQFMVQDAKTAINFYLSEVDPNDKQKLGAILSKVKSLFEISMGISEEHTITDKECGFLEELAKKKLLRGEYSEASCMYRFLVQFNPEFSGAWVGWAICEEEQQHLEFAEYIYQLANDLLPNDYYICLFAADFYISINKKEKAKEILEKAKSQLEADKMESSHAFEHIQIALQNLSK